MRGRKPTPTALKELRGNPGKRALPKNEPAALGRPTDPPDWLDPVAQEAWRFAIANAPVGVLGRIDVGVLGIWCTAYSLHRAAYAEITKRGRAALVYRAPQADVLLINPYVSVMNKQAQIMLKAASELGFTPASRPRLTGNGDLPPPRRADPNDDRDEDDHAPPIAQFLASNPDTRH